MARIEADVRLSAANVAIINDRPLGWRFFALRLDQLHNRSDILLVEIPAIQTAHRGRENENVAS